MTEGMKHQKAAVDSGQWILYRYNPDRAQQGLNLLEIDWFLPMHLCEIILKVKIVLKC